MSHLIKIYAVCNSALFVSGIYKDLRVNTTADLLSRLTGVSTSSWSFPVQTAPLGLGL